MTVPSIGQRSQRFRLDLRPRPKTINLETDQGAALRRALSDAPAEVRSIWDRAAQAVLDTLRLRTRWQAMVDAAKAVA